MNKNRVFSWLMAIVLSFGMLLTFQRAEQIFDSAVLL